MVLDSYNVKLVMVLVAVVVTVSGYAAMQNRYQRSCDPCMTHAYCVTCILCVT